MTGPGVRSAAQLSAAIEDSRHGTVAGYSRHRRKGEKPCKRCRDADTQRKADAGARASAWRAAQRRLAAVHRAEFSRYYNEEKVARGV